MGAHQSQPLSFRNLQVQVPEHISAAARIPPGHIPEPEFIGAGRDRDWILRLFHCVRPVHESPVVINLHAQPMEVRKMPGRLFKSPSESPDCRRVHGEIRNGHTVLEHQIRQIAIDDSLPEKGEENVHPCAPHLKIFLFFLYAAYFVTVQRKPVAQPVRQIIQADFLAIGKIVHDVI